MSGAERKIEIIKELEINKSVTIEDLATRLNVSKMTIRRDLDHLEKLGQIYRVHGGALSINSVSSEILNEELPYISKEISNKAQKEAIGRSAAELIKDGQSIILDAGTTCLEIAKNLGNKRNISVVTNDIRIMNELYNNTNIALHCPGGVVQSKVGAIIGNHAIKYIESISVDHAFIGVTAIDNNFNITTPTCEKAFLKRTIMNSANNIVMVTDGSKFGRRCLNKICSLKEVDVLITDKAVSANYITRIENIISKLIIA